MKLLLQASKWLLITAVTSVLLLEAVLQIGALIVRDDPRGSAGFLSLDNTLRVLAVGDSHTYGLYLGADETYPAQLQSLWQAAASQQRDLEIINVGFPGTNSSRVLSNMDNLLSTFKPDVVVLLVGINDYWTESVAPPGATAQKSALLQVLTDHSRVYKLFYMLQRQFYNADKLAVDSSMRDVKYNPATNEAFNKTISEDSGKSGDIANAIRYGDTTFSIGFQSSALQRNKPMQQLYKNLLSIVDIAQQHKVQLLLMTYENDTDQLFQSVNNQVRRAAAKHNTTVLELAPVFAQQCPDLNNCPLLFPDFHATAAGQAEIAKLLKAALIDL